MALATRLTIDDFEQLSDEEANNKELVDGELVDVAGNIWGGNAKRSYLGEVLTVFVRRERLGRIITEQGFDFGGNAHAPDVAFIRRDREHLIDRRRRVQRFVPDLAIEVVSPDDKLVEIARKAGRYRHCGTSEVWLFLPDTREAYVYSDGRNVILKDDAYFEPAAIPGFRLALSEFFDSE